MADGTSRPIEDVNVGDKVMATDPVAGKSEPKQVTQLHRNTDKDLTDLTARDQDGVTKVETTWHHPFWNASERKWSDAKDLKPGTKLLVKGKGAVTVVAVLNKLGVEEMRDLTVAGIHTYYVIASDQPVLVHNNNCLDDDDFTPAPSMHSEALGPLENVQDAYDRNDYGGRRATRNPAANAIVAAANGTPCSQCGRTMVSRTPTSPQAEHDPSLVEFHYEHGGHRMALADRAAYGTSGGSLNGANCRICQSQQGSQLSRYSTQMRKKYGL